MKNPLEIFWKKVVTATAKTSPFGPVPYQAKYNDHQKTEAQVPSYMGGSYNRYNSGLSTGAKYPYGLSSTGSVRYFDHWGLRQNARDAYHESMQARALIERFNDTVIDSGLILEPTPKYEILGIDAETAEAWARDVEERFDSWARSKNQHRSRTLNFYQAQRLYGIQAQRDGENFVRLFYSDKKDLINPLQFDFIDPNQVRGYAFTNTFYNDNFGDGIIRDEDGAEKAVRIWIRDSAKKDALNYINVDVPMRSEDGRPMMLHGFTPEYSGQGRGYSRLAHALQEFENITDFTQAQIKKAINQSNIVGFVKPSKDAPAVNPFEGIGTAFGSGPAVEQFGSVPKPADGANNVTQNATLPLINFYSSQEATLEVPGSLVIGNLQAGEEFKSVENTAPSESFNGFVDAFTSYLCASFSIPLEVVLMKFNQNYSASRAALILFWRVATIWRHEYESDFLNPIYEAWLSEEIALGRIQAPGWSDPVLKSAWLNNKWIGSPMPNIDPQKTATADKAYIEMGATTLDRVARNLNGSSGKSNRAKLRRELEELSVPPWSKAKDMNNFSNNKDDKED